MNDTHHPTDAEIVELYFARDEEAIRNAFSVQPREGAVFLPHVMSRKKQVIPSLSALWG